MKLSIITVNYNNAEGLERTIQSVQSQTWKDYEHIIIDAASTDGSVEIIHKYSAGIAKWISEPDRGIYDGMNKGIDLSYGEYCIFLNSGDVFYNSLILERVSSMLSGEDFLYGDVELVYNNSNKKIKYYPDKFLLNYLSFEMICHQVIFFKSSSLLELGKYSENFKFCSDYEILLKFLLKFNSSYSKIPFTIASYKMDGISTSKESASLVLKERKIIWEENIPKEVRDIIASNHKYTVRPDIKSFYEFNRLFLYRVLLKILSYFK
jgi:glycosyltransferase involved in cell wall biosynthesis